MCVASKDKHMFQKWNLSILSDWTPLKLGKRHGKCKYGSSVDMDSRLYYDGKDFYILIPKRIPVKKNAGDGIVAFENHINMDKYD